MKFLDGPGAREAVRQLVSTADRCDIAVAFWGAGAGDHLGLLQRKKPSTIVCNLLLGGTNPAAIRALRGDGRKVVQLNDLHAKVYLFDNAAIVGSSNASTNGLTFQESDGIGWREANILVEDRAVLKEISDWFEALEPEPITEKDLKRADDLWSQRRLLARKSGNSPFLLENLKTRPDYFRDRRAWLVVTSSGLSSEGQKALENIQNTQSADIDAFEDFPLPTGEIVALALGSQGEATFEGFWERTPKLEDLPLTGGQLNLVLKRDDILGLRWKHSEKSEWRRIAEKIRQSKHWNAEHGTALVSLEVLADLVRS